MAVTTTAHLNSIVDRLRTSYPDIRFEFGKVYRWSPSTQTVYYANLASNEDLFRLLHELGHGVLGHTSFDQDIELLAMERQAWLSAQNIAKTYEYVIDDEAIENALDSYRDWLHARSRCPKCPGTGVQDKTTSHYVCILCRAQWRANDARQCGLKRYQTKMPLR